MTKNMTSGSPLRHIVSFAVPLFAGMLLQQLYNITDTVIVSKTLGEDALAAVGSIGPANFLILGFCMGIAGGFAIPVAQRFGAKDLAGVKRYTGNILWIGAFAICAVTALAVLLCMPILKITKTPENILDMAHDYLFVIFWGIPAMFTYNVLAGLIRSLGDSRSPLILLIFSTCINVGLDLLFILAFHMGTMGAALATVIAQMCSVLGCLLIIARRLPELHLTKADVMFDFMAVKQLLRVGLPMGLLFSIMGVGSIFLQTAVNTLGSMSVAAVAAGGRLEGILASVTLSLGNAMTTYCAQNLGAGKIDRIRKGVGICVLIGLAYSLISFIAVWLFGKTLALLFIDAESTALLELTYRYMRICAAFFWTLSLVHIVRLAIQGLGYGKVVLVAGLLEMVGRGAIGLFFVPVFGFTAACFAAPSAWILADCFIIPMFLVIMKREAEKIPPAEI
ncbi:MAG: MATE family efflux transporter [Oscillospiraceae bacterium]|jgi:putative MATE family efflux protein|nr:MATE family efflux transporter [Oscillospiraceae bacterium]